MFYKLYIHKNILDRVLRSEELIIIKLRYWIDQNIHIFTSLINTEDSLGKVNTNHLYIDSLSGN